MKIDILCNDGSPLGVTLSDLHGENGRVGVGGAEAALLTMCEAWAMRGDNVVLYNNPLHPNDVFEQRPIGAFDKNSDRDILIIFRSPNTQAIAARGKKTWWSCDQYTVGNFKDFAPMVDKIVTISPYHSDYFVEHYGITNSTPIDLPVRTWEYDQEVERIPNQLLFCSVPDRGLHILADVWDTILANVPDAGLIVTSDYRLWGNPYAMTEPYLIRFSRKAKARFLGAIKRSELVKYQLQSDIQAYPCSYEELFCISTAECQVAGAYPITSDCGALRTTNMGSIIKGNVSDGLWQEAFVSKIVYLLQHRGELEMARWAVQEKAKKRFNIDKILKEWDTVFNG